jgi:hypothetical protein
VARAASTYRNIRVCVYFYTQGFDISAPDVVEAYVSGPGLGRLRERYWMEPTDLASANVFLRVVPDRVWPRIANERFAQVAAAAIDLTESNDDRSRRAGIEAIERLEQK